MLRMAALALGVFGLSLLWCDNAPAQQGRDEPATVTRDGVAYGPPRHFSGVYFSNFENSKFIACDRAKGECEDWAGKEQEWLSCEGDACLDLERRIQSLVGSHDRWALYGIDFVGRRSVQRAPRKFLGDTESKVRLERIERFALLKTE